MTLNKFGLIPKEQAAIDRLTEALQKLPKSLFLMVEPDNENGFDVYRRETTYCAVFTGLRIRCKQAIKQ